MYWAHLAAALAAEPRSSGAGDDPATFVEGALNELAPIYRRTLEPHPPKSAMAMRDETLGALSRRLRALRDDAGSSRIAGIVALADELEAATRERDPAALRRLKATLRRRPHLWEREQVQIALARTLGRLDEWSAGGEGVRRADRRCSSASDRTGWCSTRCAPSTPGRCASTATSWRRRSSMAAARRAPGPAERVRPARGRRGALRAVRSTRRRSSAWKQTMWLTPNDPYLQWRVAFCHWKHRPGPPRRRPARLRCATPLHGFEQAALLFGTRHGDGLGVDRSCGLGRVHGELGETDVAVQPSARGGRLRADASWPAQLLLGEHTTRRSTIPRPAAASSRPCSSGAATGRARAALLDAGWGDTLTRPTMSRKPRSPARSAGARSPAHGTERRAAAGGLAAVQRRDRGAGAHGLGRARPGAACPSRCASAMPGLEQLAGALAARRLLREHARELDLRVRDPRPRAHALVHGQRGLEVRDRLLALPSRSASRPRWRAAEPVQVDAQPIATLRSAYGSSRSCSACGVRRVAERGGRLGQVADGAEPDPVERQAAEVVGREARRGSRAPRRARPGLGEQVGEHADPAGDRREALGVGAHRAPRAARAGRARAAACSACSSVALPVLGSCTRLPSARPRSPRPRPASNSPASSSRIAR